MHLDLDLIFLQEAELINQNNEWLNIDGYDFFCSNTKPKSRIAAYIKSKFSYTVSVSNKVEAIAFKFENLNVTGIYRPFKVPNSANYMLNLIDFCTENLGNEKNVIIGDFNLDFIKISDKNYQHRKLYDDWLNFLATTGLVQLNHNLTWRRVVKGNIKESILDHAYSDSNWNIHTKDLDIGDHLALLLTKENQENMIFKAKKRVRYWKKYSQEDLLNSISDDAIENFPLICAEQINNNLDQMLMSKLHKLAPILQIRPDENKFIWSEKIIRLRRKKENLLKKAKRSKRPDLYSRCRTLDRDLRKLILSEEKKKIRNLIDHANPKSLWDAVNRVKSAPSPTDIPYELIYKDSKITCDFAKAEVFRDVFESKINIETSTVLEETISIDQLRSPDTIFTAERLSQAIKLTKKKQSYGHDLVPMRVLIDAMPAIFEIVLTLFQRIEDGDPIPAKWRMARILPLHKKGNKLDPSNYRPISNLNSISKIFERCLLLYLREIEAMNSVDLTHEKQLGFKPNCSTAKMGLIIQSKIALALEKGEKLGLISLDLSAAFDLVNHSLLHTRLRNMGLPTKFCLIINDWLKNRLAYVESNQCTSTIFNVDKGTVQGSVLGPVLFSLYIRQILEAHEELWSYADDSYLLISHKETESLINKLSTESNEIVKDLKKSGMFVNEKKTEFIIFEKGESKGTVSIQIGETRVVNKDEINVLGVLFDKNLTWNAHVNKVISQAKKDCFGLKTLAKFFNESEMLKLSSALVLSKLYYNSVIWMNDLLKSTTWQRLLSASSYILRTALSLYDYSLISFEDIHLMCSRATPKNFSAYHHLCMLHDILTTRAPQYLFDIVSKNASFESRSGLIYFTNSSKNRFGMQSFQNRLLDLSKKLFPHYEQLSKDAFKSKMKLMYLK